MKISPLVLRGIALLVVVCGVAGFANQTARAAGPFVYVSNNSAGTVLVIDTSTNSVAATIALPPPASCLSDCAARSPEGLAVTPGGKFVYVANNGNGTVSVIATSTNTVVATISLPTFSCACSSKPVGVAITPDGSRVYVTDVGTELIDVIDTSTNAVIFPPSNEEGDVSALNGPIAITPDGSAAFYTFGSGSVGRFDTNPSDVFPNVPITSYNTHTATLTVGSSPHGIAITPNGAFIYVANQVDSTLSIIPNTPPNFGGGGFPTAYPTVTLPADSAPYSVAISADGTKVFVVDLGFDGTVSVISTATNLVTATINMPATPLSGIAITADGSKAYVADPELGQVDVINTANDVVSSVPAGPNGSPFGVASPASQTKILGGPGTTTTFTFNTDTVKLTGLTNLGGEQVTVDAFLVLKSQFPTGEGGINGFQNETCIPYGDDSSNVDTCFEGQIHCQLSPTDTTPCNFIYLIATGYALPADLSGGIGGPDFLVAHGVDCPLTSSSTVQSIFLSYDPTVQDPTTHGGSRGPSCYVATYTPGAPVITSGTRSRFTGWGPPVADGSLNQVKAGSTRPLSFQFFDVLGNPVPNLSFCNSYTQLATRNVCMDNTVPTPWVNIASYGIVCPNGAPVNSSTDTLPVTASGGSGFQNLGGGSYQLNWQTMKSWKGACANVVVTFDSTFTVIPAMIGFQFN